MQVRSRRRAAAGFSLIELLVTVVIMAEILVGVAILLDSSNRLARSQTHLAALQQSLRVGQSEVVRYARMAGVGGLPISRLGYDATNLEPDGGNTDYELQGFFPRSGFAVSVLNNVAAGDTIVTASHPSSTEDADGEVLENSDVLILRGVFSTPLYYLAIEPTINVQEDWCPTDPCDLTDAAIDRLVVVPERIRIVGDTWEDYPQDLTALSERLLAAKNNTVNAHRPVALILRDLLNPNAFVVMEFDHGKTTAAQLAPADCPEIPATAVDTPQCIQFYVRLDPSAPPGNGYGEISTGTNLQAGQRRVVIDAGPPAREVFVPSTIGSIGLLEEYRFFVRREYEVPGVDTTRLSPVLSRARFLPGTDVQIDRVDVADNVIDLQIAIGVDSDGDTLVTETLDGTNDEVLYNHTLDTTSGVSPYGYRAPPSPTPPPPVVVHTWYDIDKLEYHFLRINTLVQSRFPDLDHLGPAIGDIEDFNRGATVTAGTHRYSDETEYHRRWLRTIVELRNLL